jgi:pimeloyl-ACP methyl ester carboxylesterase
MPFPAFAAAAGAIREGRAPSVQETLARWFTAKELRDNGAAVRMARDELAHASESDWAAALDAIAGYDSSRRSPGLTMPVTLIAAGADAVSTPEVMTDMARRIPHAEIVVRPEWSHMSPFVDPTGLAELIRSSPRASTATRQ